MEVIEQFQKLGIIPVVKINDAKDAMPLGKALCEGGLPVVEVTFRTEAAEEAIRLMVNAYPNMLVGAGTVLTTKQVDRAIEAGAKFIVSPGLNPKIVRYCQERNIVIIPGASTPSEIEMVLELGLDVVKFFPAEASGGLAKIKAMAAPYTKVKFMPTGGITENNILSYLNFSKVIACGGTWMVSEVLINEGNFEEVKRLTREAVNKMLGFKLSHIGINAKNEIEAEQIADNFEKLFQFDKKSGNSSVFAGMSVEVMKKHYLGANGHIAIGTNYIERAMYQMELKGIKFDMNTAKYQGERLVAVYLEEELGGFAIHLLQNR